jgi:hypothetical protein
MSTWFLRDGSNVIVIRCTWCRVVAKGPVDSRECDNSIPRIGTCFYDDIRFDTSHYYTILNSSL